MSLSGKASCHLVPMICFAEPNVAFQRLPWRETKRPPCGDHSEIQLFVSVTQPALLLLITRVMFVKVTQPKAKSYDEYR